MTIIENFEILIQNIPNIHDYNSIMEFCATLNSEAVFLERYATQLQSEYLVHCSNTIKEIDDDTWKKIKSSSTIQTLFYEGTFNQEKLKDLKQSQYLIEQYKTVLFNINTLIAHRIK